MASEKNNGGRSKWAFMKAPKKKSPVHLTSPTLHHPHQCHTPIIASGSVPVRSGAPSSSMHPHQHVINANTSGGGIWFGPNNLDFGENTSFGSGPPPETSNELSSMPNHKSQPQTIRFNGSMMWRLPDLNI